ncbi:MAG: DUF1073 domain-containing protein [Succiniclasticum sp.]|nr:DUF1073 domain-containing protein [Succiniclasticum sp.]
MELRRTQLIKKIQEGLCWGRLYGGAIGIMLIKGQGSPEQLAMPLALEEMVPGDFKGLMILDRWNGVSPSSELVDDISDPEYGLPDAYIVTDPVDGAMTRVHHTRCIRFVGNNLPFWERQAELYWGASVIESVFDELKKRDNVSWNIAQLTFLANLRVLKMNDIGQTLAATDPQSQAELYRTLTAQNWLASNMGIQIMDAADGFETHQYTFGGLADCYQQFIMDVSGAAEIPVTKLFGRSPSGLNATGESDLQNYYDMIGEKQESILRPILNKLLPPFMVSMFGAVPDDLDFDFNPVSEPSDKERMELAKTGTDNVVAALNAGMISKRTGLQELKQQSERTGVWTNITDEDIEKAPDEIEDPGEMMPPGMDFGGGEKTDAPKPPQRPGNEPGQGNGQAGNENATAGESGRDAALFHVLDADWDESEHPRGDDGKFRAGSGVGKNKGERDQARQKLTALWNQKSTPEVQAQIEQLKTVSGDNVVKEDLTPGQYDANMRNAKKQLLGRSFPGGKITKITSHANVRMIGRDIPPRQVMDILQTAARSFPGNRPNTTCYEKDNKRVVVDGNGQIMSVMHVYRRRKDGNKSRTSGFFKV